MGEANEGHPIVEEVPLHLPSNSPELLQIITLTPRSTDQNGSRQAWSEDSDNDQFESSQKDAWLPITESRNGNIYTAVFHLLSSGFGFQALVLPLAFASLGWAWGIICFSAVFAWQLYTIWLLVQLHESVPGTRCSRYLHLCIVAFGPKLGKLLGIFPVMYLSGGTCVMLIITGGGNLELFFKMVCGDAASRDVSSLTGVEWFLVFTCMAIVLAQRPNLNAIAGFSLIGAVTALISFTLLWVLPICMGRPSRVSYARMETMDSDMARFSNVLNSLGIIFLAFRGHNLVLEIQGTLRSSPKHPSKKLMWRGVTLSYIVIAISFFPLAIAGYWAYGNKMPKSGGLLRAFSQFHGNNTSKFLNSLIYLLVIVNSLSCFQIYAMPVFDNLEIRYTSIKNQRCPWWARIGLRLFFGGVAFLAAVAFPFLGSLGGLIGGMTLPLAYAYPCFMWISIKKLRPSSAMGCLNLVLGCLGLVLSVLLVVAALWTLATKGLNTNFFQP